MLSADDFISIWVRAMKAEIAEIHMRNLGARMHDILGELSTASAMVGLAEHRGKVSDADKERVDAKLRRARAMLPRR